MRYYRYKYANAIGSAWARAILGVAGALCVFVARHDMRKAGSGIDPAFGLAAYGLGLGLLMLAVPHDLLASQRPGVAEHGESTDTAGNTTAED